MTKKQMYHKGTTKLTQQLQSCETNSTECDAQRGRLQIELDELRVRFEMIQAESECHISFFLFCFVHSFTLINNFTTYLFCLLILK